MAGNGFKFYSGLLGSNVLTVGNDESVFMYTDLSSAVSAAKPGDYIQLYPGTYTIGTTALAVSKPNVTIEGMGAPGAVIVTTSGTNNLINVNVPASYNAASTITFKNISFTHTNAGAGDTINIDNNGGAAQDLTVNIIDCSVAVTGTGYAINVVQTTTTKDIVLNVTGNPVQHSIGKSYWAGAKALSAAVFYGVYLTSDITVPAGNAVASTLNVWGCLVVGAAVTTGGNAANITNYNSNIKSTAGFKAALAATAAGDFDALGTELSLGVAAV